MNCYLVPWHVITFIYIPIVPGDRTARLGETIQGRKVQVSLDMASSAEFGPLAGFRLLSGRVGQAREELLVETPVEGHQYRSHWEGAFELQPGTTYFRAEAESQHPEHNRLADNSTTLALTNPVWVES